MRDRFMPVNHPFPRDHSESGGVALEYILVTTFALATTLAALGYLGKTLRTRLAELEVASLRTAGGEQVWEP